MFIEEARLKHPMIPQPQQAMDESNKENDEANVKSNHQKK
jgi:hypothetical protein